MGFSQLALTHDEQESRDQPDASGLFLRSVDCVTAPGA
jgi:hypothetical protein